MTNFEDYKAKLTLKEVAELNIYGCKGCAYVKGDKNCLEKNCVDGATEWLNKEKLTGALDV